MDRISAAINWRGLAMLAQLDEARTALNHQTLYGSNNESLLLTFLRQHLPSSWSVGSGEVLRADGVRSPQCDIIVYDSFHYPPAFVSESGAVVVVAHSVGAVIEVKSRLASGEVSDPSKEGDVQALATQMNRLHDFFAQYTDSAMAQATANQRSLPKDLILKYIGLCPRIYGFAFSSSVQPSTIESALRNHLSSDIPARVFVLDVPRPAEAIKAKLDEAVTNGGNLADIKSFTDWSRMPNGRSFHRDLLGADWVVSTLETPSGCLNSLKRELMDEIRAVTPLAAELSQEEHESIYSTYQGFAGLYK